MRINEKSMTAEAREIFNQHFETSGDVYNTPLYRPICVNSGCGKPVHPTKKNAAGDIRYRPLCSKCHNAGHGKGKLALGVIPFKKGKCSNADGHLNFPCCTNFKLIPPDITGITEIDHINGDNKNNDLSNLQELCVACHRIKGHYAGDFNGFKNGRRR